MRLFISSYFTTGMISNIADRSFSLSPELPYIGVIGFMPKASAVKRFLLDSSIIRRMTWSDPLDVTNKISLMPYLLESRMRFSFLIYRLTKIDQDETASFFRTCNYFS